MIENWKVSRGSIILAQVLTFLQEIEQTKVTTKALDGTIYIQTIGNGVNYATVSILASREQMQNVNLSEAEGALIQVVYRGKTYLGYIESPPNWNDDVPGSWYTGTFKLLIEEVL